MAVLDWFYLNFYGLWYSESYQSHIRCQTRPPLPLSPWRCTVDHEYKLVRYKCFIPPRNPRPPTFSRIKPPKKKLFVILVIGRNLDADHSNRAFDIMYNRRVTRKKCCASPLRWRLFCSYCSHEYIYIYIYIYIWERERECVCVWMCVCVWTISNNRCSHK